MSKRRQTDRPLPGLANLPTDFTLRDRKRGPRKRSRSLPRDRAASFSIPKPPRIPDVVMQDVGPSRPRKKLTKAQKRNLRRLGRNRVIGLQGAINAKERGSFKAKTLDWVGQVNKKGQQKNLPPASEHLGTLARTMNRNGQIVFKFARRTKGGNDNWQLVSANVANQLRTGSIDRGVLTNNLIPAVVRRFAELDDATQLRDRRKTNKRVINMEDPTPGQLRLMQDIVREGAIVNRKNKNGDTVRVNQFGRADFRGLDTKFTRRSKVNPQGLEFSVKRLKASNRARRRGRRFAKKPTDAQVKARQLFARRARAKDFTLA